MEHGSVALPAVMRSGSSGPETFNVGSMPSPQLQVLVGQMHHGHMPPLVSSHCAYYMIGSVGNGSDPAEFQHLLPGALLFLDASVKACLVFDG